MAKCVRVYNNGSRVMPEIPDVELEDWIEYNRVMRFGCAIFVDGECKQFGYLGEERCREIERELESNE